MELENYLSKKLDRAGFNALDIIKTPLVTRIVLHVAKPGMAIGKNGSTIKELTEVISKKYNIDNPQIEIQELKDANLNARIIAEKMASMIQGGFSWRSVAYRVIKDIMSANAQGVELVVKGKLSGKGGRKRKQRIAIGYMKKIGYQTKFVDTAKVAAYPKASAIGIKLSIIHPNIVFPDKINVNDVVKNAKALKLQAEEQKTETVVKEEKKEDVEEVKKDTLKTKEVKKEVIEEVKKEVIVEEVKEDNLESTEEKKE